MAFLMQWAAPHPSIVGFELAGTLEKADAVLNQWGETGRQRAIRQTWLDFLFLVLYAVTLALFCWRAAQGQTGIFRILGLAVGWLALFAGLLDGVENIAMLQSLYGSRKPVFPALAYICASAKFMLILVAASYLLVYALLRGWARLWGSRSRT